MTSALKAVGDKTRAINALGLNTTPLKARGDNANVYKISSITKKGK